MANSLPDFDELQALSSDQNLIGSDTTAAQFLQVQIGANLPVLLPVHQVTEVLSISENQIMPMPHMPAWVMGIYNWRGEILWMVDLGQLCGLPPWYEYPLRRSAHAAVVLNLSDPSTHAKGQVLGLVVRQIEDMEWCNLEAVQPLDPNCLPLRLSQFSVGCWQKSKDMSLAILDGEQLLSAISHDSNTYCLGN